MCGGKTVNVNITGKGLLKFIFLQGELYKTHEYRSGEFECNLTTVSPADSKVLSMSEILLCGNNVMRTKSSWLRLSFDGK